MSGQTKKMAITYRETCRLVGTDFERLRVHYGLKKGFGSTVNIFMTNSMMAVFLFRWSHYFYYKRMRVIARLVFLLNLALTGAELLPQATVGEGFVVIHTVASGIDCTIGDNVTIFGRTCIGSNPGDFRDIGAGPSLPLVGNNVRFGLGSHVLGPVRIGDNALVGAGAVVMRDVPDGATVYAPLARILSSREKDV